MATDEFLVSHDKTTQALGSQQGVYTVTDASDGHLISRTVYKASAVMTAEVWVYVSRGHESDPGVEVSTKVSNLHPGATAAFSDVTGASPTNMPSWSPKWEAASGTVITVHAARVNEAGFWEKTTTVEQRTCTPSYNYQHA